MSTSIPTQVPLGMIDDFSVGLWQPDHPVTDQDFVNANHTLFDGSFAWPVMVLRSSAVRHNIATLAQFCERHGLTFAPHGKTTMAPVLFREQVAAGAWGITVATANQVLAAWSFGVERILLANELVDAPRLAWIADQLQRHPAREILFYVDSLAGIELVESAVHDHVRERPLRVLVEIGHEKGRTGARGGDALEQIARAVVESDVLELAGVAAYEGGLPNADQVRSYLTQFRDASIRLARAGLLSATPIVTAGGSAWFDIVAEVLGQWPEDVTPTVVLRSGAYVSHDDGTYFTRTPFNRIHQEGSLVPAIEVWAQVISRPEPGLAIVAMGKREVPYDEGLPVTRAVRRIASGQVEDLAGLQVRATNDHHSYLDLPAGVQLDVGDLVCFGVSHPCTAFDKWRVVALVEDDDTVSGLCHTYF